MRENRKNQLAKFKDPEATAQQFHNPLLSSPVILTSKQRDLRTQVAVGSSLFDQGPSRGVLKQFKGNTLHNKSLKFPKSEILSKILNNTKKKSQSQKLQSQNDRFDGQLSYDFNVVLKLSYPQTPGFKMLLQSPFTKFNLMYRSTIQQLTRNKQTRTSCQSVNFDQSPLKFYNPQNKIFSATKFFVGLSMTAKQRYSIYDALLFAKLACYSDPFSELAWKKYISLEQERGQFKKAAILSKTAYLLLRSEDMARLFLTNSDRDHVDMNSVKGLVAGVENLEVFERVILPESARLQLKHRGAWRGIKVLFQLCCYNDLRLAVCSLILFLTKYLENIGYIDAALLILRRSFGRSMSKLEIYTLYIDMSIRKHGYLKEQDLQDVTSNNDNISGENRYRLSLELAEYFYNQNDEKNFKKFIQKSYEDAKTHCAAGSGKNKAMKQIYFTVTKLKCIQPAVESLNDHVIFEKNRYRFINGLEMIDHDFTEWKYFLHYGLVKRHEVLLKISKRWNQTGRILAEWIHCLRPSRPALVMLRIWRQKIELVPKSGQLWCEGGRIYAQLQQYKNASQCFKNAIHFTPQYGDSFIEELRLLLRQGRFQRIDELRRFFYVAEPFYGPVLSYLKLNQGHTRKLSMSEIWDFAINEIKTQLYSSNKLYTEATQPKIRTLTAYIPYNKAFIKMQTPEERSKLFTSYEQMENK